jgi:bifunctional DNase/RNase
VINKPVDLSIRVANPLFVVDNVEDKEEDTGTDEDDEEEDEANGVIFVVFILVGFSFLTVLILLII